MDGRAQTTSYEQTGFFSTIVIDYLNGNPLLAPFYTHSPSVEGLKNALSQKVFSAEARQLLVSVLKEQYSGVSASDAVEKNLGLLLQPNTFSICTAHQPNLFTGPLYFIYKILHAIKLAEFCKVQFPQNNFVPVYFMGSEDADLEELNHFSVEGKKYEWKTDQKGAVGRMLVDKGILELINELEGQLSVQPFGDTFIDLLKECFTLQKPVQTATFEVVHQLFEKFGLLILIPDHPQFKKAAQAIFEQELLQQSSSKIVGDTMTRINQHYKVQAHPREINLFYLKGDSRERIITNKEGFAVNNTSQTFLKEEMLEELRLYPERFSPNVILRGLFQETILPNIAFIGGGGELAYWLQLKDLFSHYKTPFPVLILRNSFLVIETKWQEKISALPLHILDLFQPQDKLFNELVKKFSDNNLSLEENITSILKVYSQVQEKAAAVDATLLKHIGALETNAKKGLEGLAQKMMRAEKKKFAAQQSKVEAIKKALFPGESLQERVENIAGFYSKYGPSFIDLMYKHLLTTEQEFTILLLDQ